MTETYVGNWLAKHGSREKLIIASKVSGPSRNHDKGIRPDQGAGSEEYPRSAA
ncbi:hypothetical protein MJ524_23260 [Escherichia coli]|nr:hypothetical protein MJ524_23260 [Escherichia coli]